MNDENAFLQGMQEHPEETPLRIAFAEWLDERGDPRGELIRLLHTLTQSVEVAQTVEVPPKSLFRKVVSSIFSILKSGANEPSGTDSERLKLENCLRSLLASGVNPVGPFFTNTIGMNFAWIPAGTFVMGSPDDEEGGRKDETQHKVTLTKGLYLAVHPVTQAAWQAVMGRNPSHHRGDDLPVERVSWEDCQEFLRKLSDREGHAYRLPSEAEWEYACRAGTTTPFFFGETISTDQANFNGNSPYGQAKEGIHRGMTTPTGSFPGNAWGLHDMHGNVWEWCADRYGNYPQRDAVDPQGPQHGDRRVLRGGSFNYGASDVRSAKRHSLVPASGNYLVGFRVAKIIAT